MRTFINSLFFFSIISLACSVIFVDFYLQKGLSLMCNMERVEYHIRRIHMDRYERLVDSLKVAKSAYDTPEKTCKWYD